MNFFKKKRKRKILLLIILIGFILPQPFTLPVENAHRGDWNPETFWYYPWGKSITHKGVDIFGKEGTNILSASYGLVVYSGELGLGGNTVLVLGPKWRFHYYAHLQKVDTKTLHWVSSGEVIGKLGKTGNAINTPPHLHYSLSTLIPYPWRIDGDKLGWMKMFFLNPLDYFPE